MGEVKRSEPSEQMSAAAVGLLKGALLHVLLYRRIISHVGTTLKLVEYTRACWCSFIHCLIIRESHVRSVGVSRATRFRMHRAVGPGSCTIQTNNTDAILNHVRVIVIYCSSQRLVQVFDDVRLVFQAHREPDKRVADPQDAPLMFWHRCVCHDCPEKEGNHEPLTETHYYQVQDVLIQTKSLINGSEYSSP